MIKRTALVVCLVITLPLLGATVVHAQQAGDTDEDGWVWVPSHLNESGQQIAGFYRQPARDGFVWIDPTVDENGLHIAGHWQPETEAPENHVYVEGHRGDDGRYNDGYWRTDVYEHHSWVDGHYDDQGSWSNGHWLPLEDREGYVWVPGYIDENGYWIPGYWRLAFRDDYTWVDGYYGDDGWYSGYWEPRSVRAGYVWVPGYVLGGVWTLGYWRHAYRNGYTWVPGHWSHGRWVHGTWYAGSWRWARHHRRSRYARYHHMRGHGYKRVHRRVRKARYAATKHHGKVKAVPVSTSHSRRAFSKRRRPADGFRAVMPRVTSPKAVAPQLGGPGTLKRNRGFTVRQPRRGFEFKKRQHAQPRVRPMPATNPRFRPGARRSSPRPTHFGRQASPPRKVSSPRADRRGKPAVRRHAPRVTPRANMNRVNRVSPRRTVTPRRPENRQAPNRLKRSTFKRRGATPTKKRSGRRSFTRGNGSRRQPARSKRGRRR